MERWTRFVLRHRAWVALAWLAVAVAGGATASHTVDRLSYEFALPHQPAYEVNQQITAQYGGGGVDDPLLLVVQGPGSRAAADGVARSVTRAVPGARTIGPGDDGAGVLAPSPTVATVVVYPPVTPGPDPYGAATPQLQQVAARATGDGRTVTVTGFPILQEGGGGDRSVLVEVLLGAGGALVVLALVFGSLLAGVPLLVAAVSILGTYLALLGLTGLTDVSFVVQYLVALIGLGVAIDYSLLVVTRWREERGGTLRGTGRGSERDRAADDEAVVRAMATAGRSVVFSGVTVAVSLAALVAVPLPFLRSIGLGGLLIPLFSVAVTLSLVPAVLSAAGSRLTWPRRRPATTRSPLWAGVAGAVLRHRWLTIVGCLVVLGALAAPVVTLSLGTAQLGGVTSATPESAAVTTAVDAGLPVGVLRPTEVVADSSGAAATARALGALDGVAAAVVTNASAGGTVLLDVWTSADPASDAGKATLGRVRAAAGDDRVGGTPAEDADFVSAVYGDVVWVVLAVAVLTFLLLARALRSLWLPVKALVLNVLSLAAAYGVTVLIWQHGVGSQALFGQDATGVITTWVPIAAFSFLFGLSMDYEVFILARMREVHDESDEPDVHRRTDHAAVEGIAFTGRLVTSAAVILVLAFVALSTVPSVEVKTLATALALGIAIDALVVRGLLAPALVGVLGRANWTLPTPLARVLGVTTRPHRDRVPEASTGG